MLAGLLAGAALWLGMPAALAASGAVPNTQLPQGGSVIAGSVTLPDAVKPGYSGELPSSVTIAQNSQNAVIQWGGGFNVGANATVNFEGPANGYNTLNYDASGNMSQIYGAINANNKGNIYIVNPAGVEISSSAQINVGSLYVSNKKMADDVLRSIDDTSNITNLIQSQAANTNADAVLMSLGNINADHVTFDGGRIVIDTERLKTDDAKMDAKYIHVRTTDAGQVVLGYDAYNEGENKGTYKDKQKSAKELATVTAAKGDLDSLNGYMWVEDIEQLQAVSTNSSGQYALRNSIDATATQDWNDQSEKTDPTDVKEGFASIGNDGNPFTGKFDGLDYNIFNLNINRNTGNVGLFGVVGNGAVIRNVTLVGGSITGGSNVGALAGSVQGSAQISNIMNSASVTGSSNVGGIIGSATSTDQKTLVFKNLVNTGTVAGTAEGAENNAGGLIGSLSGGTLSGTSYNLGGVTGKGFNVGGLVGTASDATLGDGTNLIYNRLNVSGKYNVGGIVGSMSGTTVQNAENSGNVTATGHTTEDYAYHTSHWKDSGGKDKVQEIKNVYVANVGGIAGKSDSTGEKKSEIKNVQNSGDVSSGTAEKTTNGTVAIEYSYYTAGNVGGIVGRAEDTNITDATNTENDVRGAHNVGGIAGYFGSSSDTVGRYTITRGVNNGGDILATGAVDENTAKEENTTDDSHNNGFVTEWVRYGIEGGEKAIIGNMGGIAGYMDGDNVYIASSANRGTVHSQDIDKEVLPVSQAANAGGIVGKIDRSDTIGKKDENGIIIIDTENIKKELGENYANAAVSNSYNTGDVRGYMGVGGVAGMMYNGEIAGSYNLGTVNTTRNKDSFTIGDYYAVNMGGVVGDTTEQTEARALLYDVYNQGQIGDETFTYYARHVGGVVGRLSGAVEKAYNTGAIYNGYSIVGGIVGWLNAGSVTNSFNTGNITVLNHDLKEESNVGGIAGDVNIATGDIVLTNVYNLGTLRSMQYKAEAGSGDKSGYPSVLGGIVGAVHRYHDNKTGTLKISNAYTTGNLYSDDTINSIVGSGSATLTNTYYIRPADTKSFDDLVDKKKDNSNKAIAYADRHNKNVWDFSTTDADDKGFSSQTGGDVTIESGQDWRIYDGNSLPILNAFLPNTEKYFSGETGVTNAMDGIASIQYGTAYDPLLTIINATDETKKLTFNWQELGASNAAGIAVYGANLTLNDFMATGGSGYFGGLIYSDGALSINAHTSGDTHNSENTGVTGDVALGSASQLYGSSVSISADGNVTIYGDVTATGNTKNGATGTDNAITDKNSGDISITGGSVDIYGQLTSAKKDAQTTVPGIGGKSDTWSPTSEDVSDYTKPMTDIGDRFGYTTGASTATGSISITAEKNGTASEDGHVNVYYGRQQKGFLDTAGNLTVSASGDVYMDSDLSVGGNLSITAGADSEAVLDISNIGQVQATEKRSAVQYLYDFLDHFSGNSYGITLNGRKQKIVADMWGTDEKFNLKKFDLNDQDTLAKHLDSLNITANKQDIKNQNIVYIWVSTGEELKNIQTYYDANKDSTNILSYNFALKNDIDASAVKDYVAIGTGSANGFTGTFDGRDNRIIGLKVDTLSDGTAQSNAGIFDTIGTVKDEKGAIIAAGKVEDLRVYSGTFNGTDNAGAVAGINNGTISNVTTFGNVVTAESKAAGGIAGDNAGAISNASASDAVTDKGSSNAGGIAGINEEKAVISDSSSNSAVNSAVSSKDNALGGIAGVNAGTLSNVDSLGVTTGIYKGTSTRYSDNVGGIAGINSGTVSNAYNESIVSGRDNVGGILGKNTGKNVENVSNAARVTGEAASDDTSDYVGGLVGSNSGSITNGRNNGEITGSQYVGGLVGNNAFGSKLSNLVNDEAASITGDNYVGGIAGSNAGTITADEKNDNLVNRGSITGQMYVGGVAGVNTGTIENTNNDVTLYVKDDTASDKNAPKYFGGVAGINGEDKEGGSKGTITNATNSANVIAINADYVGGIVGWNTKNGILSGAGNSNEGRVEGKSYVGGVAGLNNAAITGELNSMIGIKNSGVVIAHQGGAGGIFGENKGNITYVEMTNNGIVTGTDGEGTGLNGTGGIFGVNSGTVTYSSLKNQVNGQVIGTQNVGGLIGVNTGTIAGGRDEKDGYYKYQIYNNGTIRVGTWNDSDQDGIIDTNEFTEKTGENIGGLVGLNGYDENTGKTGSITAAYNTGAIIAGSSKNVGGIAGSNTGKLDQVFNTVITGVNADGSTQYGSITGGTTVGGIVGSNTGTVSNAYNTTGVSGNGDVGLIAGSNTNTAKDSIRNVYSIGAGENRLIGSGSAVTNGFILSESEAKKSGSYTGFGLNGNGFSKKSSDGIWKIYDGSSMALLKVFLTKAEVTKDPNLVYNGQEQVIGTGYIDAVYGNVTIPPLGQNSHKDAGSYDDWLYSSQIAASTDKTTGFNPNNLGYDIDFRTALIRGRPVYRIFRTVKDGIRCFGMLRGTGIEISGNGRRKFISLQAA